MLPRRDRLRRIGSGGAARTCRWTAPRASGALSDDSLNEDALAAGHYDAAQVDMYLVDWSEPSLHRAGCRAASSARCGATARAFTAELRASCRMRLNAETGRLYTADLCRRSRRRALRRRSRRSGVSRRRAGDRARRRVGLHRDRADSVFRRMAGSRGGRLTFYRRRQRRLTPMEVKRHRDRLTASLSSSLWQAMPRRPIALGDTFGVTAGCDKRFATCRDRFANALNFRGFPHIPGNDFVMRYVADGEPGHDGKRLAGVSRHRARVQHETPNDDYTRAHRHRGARLDRHALPAPGAR